MLHVQRVKDALQIDNGYGPDRISVTRYLGEQWPQVGAWLLCGMADAIPNIGIATIGKSTSFRIEQFEEKWAANAPVVHRDWLPIDSAPGKRRFEPVYWYSDELGWVFVPASMEDVEEAIWWSMWHPGNEPGGFRSFVFPDGREFRSLLDGENWENRSPELVQAIQHRCMDAALFEFIAGPGGWAISPGSVDLDYLERSANAVAARISTMLVD